MADATTAQAQSQPATSPVSPGKDWENVSPEIAGFTREGLAAVERSLYALPTTSLMVVTSGKVAYRYGFTEQVSYLASARKSVLSMLYGKYVANGTIDLDRTIAELGIEEDKGLLPIEKTTRVRDLLISSSGVYHPAGSPGGDESTPPRGSKQPGAYFHYNNWDFNVLGAIFEKLTGNTVFQALGEDLAAPLQMQDFDPSRQRMMGYQNQSRYLAYHLFLSGRDMARLGVLMANKGQWNGQQIIPAAWVAESTQLRVKAGDMAEKGPLGYSYLWWIPESRTAPEWAGSFLANGNFGQFILVLPAIDTVIVHRRAVTDEFSVARNLGETKFEPPKVSASEFLKVADLVVAARKK
ncbi:serine hydrolase domain-containing protein [Microvirga yunnanensis]|uniref:serine hydrolase domain-containing protein n=1 Tax=Microvirga yunnanensis TaxID=2953740 RepID=UPI0021C800A2|nr:serine hydrolase [Microvirga sp. HBU65207]